MNISRLELKVPPVAVFLIAAALIYFIHPKALLENIPILSEVANIAKSAGDETTFNFVVKFISAASFTLGTGVGIAAVVTFRRAKTSVDPIHLDKASQVVRHGVFAYSRNPMYLGLALILLALCLYLHNLLGIIFILLFICYLNRFQIRPEETMLKSLFGKEYESYLDEVRRWI